MHFCGFWPTCKPTQSVRHPTNLSFLWHSVLFMSFLSGEGMVRGALHYLLKHMFPFQTVFLMKTFFSF